MFHRKMLVGMVGGIRLVGAPAVRPDLGRTQQLPACAQDDSDGLVIED
jgi:hypothetical protein